MNIPTVLVGYLRTLVCFGDPEDPRWRMSFGGYEWCIWKPLKTTTGWVQFVFATSCRWPLLERKGGREVLYLFIFVARESGGALLCTRSV